MKRRMPIFLLIFVVISYYPIKKSADERVKHREAVDIRMIPSPRVANWMAIGFKPAIADLFWIEGLNYFGWQLTRKDRDYKYLRFYFDVIMHLDPLFQSFYEWAATSMIYNAMEITRKSVVESIRYVNKGIIALHEVGRYDPRSIQKGAFNYALETNFRHPSLDYFAMSARISPAHRNLFLVGSAYASIVEDEQQAFELKLEYLGHTALEAQSREDLVYAFQVLSSSKFNSFAGQFARSLRINLEKDEEVRKLLEQRLTIDPFLAKSITSGQLLESDPRLRAAMTIDLSKNWLPRMLHLLLVAHG